MAALIIVCLIIIGFLGYKLYQKKTIDTQLVDEYQNQVAQVKEELQVDQEALSSYQSKLLDIQIKVNTERQRLTDLYNQLDSAKTSLTDARAEYNNLVNDRMQEIDQLMDEQRQRRQKSLDETFNEMKGKYEMTLSGIEQECKSQIQNYQQMVEEARIKTELKINEYDQAIQEQQEKFTQIQQTLIQQEKDRQERLYYTIQLPEEYRDDIDYLLTNVRPLIRHPDILSKLVWSNYIRPYLDDLCKRADLRDEPGIYKITSINDNKAYIGKSTNVKKRIQDHMKSVVGVEAIADQAVHHAILKEGFWNWTIEVLTYCEKDKLSELEKYYIDFFKTQEYGYNKRDGG